MKTELKEMEERVILFMELCTCDFSYTNYSLEDIKNMIEDKNKENIGYLLSDIIEFDDSVKEVILKFANKYKYDIL